jgi:hypothetical protein
MNIQDKKDLEKAISKLQKLKDDGVIPLFADGMLKAYNDLLPYTDMFNRKKKLGRRTIKQWFMHIVRCLLRKEYCKICGQELTEIRGRYPKQPRRKVCACCATEKLEWIEEQNNVGAKCSNNA